jgi:DNA-binding Lrp family transcriptional regulator
MHLGSHMENIYVLIETEAGKLEPVLNRVKGIQGVIDASAVTGIYDIIAKLQTDNITKALSTVVKEMKNIEGIKSIESLVGVKV